ncbi:unnamed protein product [Brachionus calyciflorus]|uniref:CCHC-type domain-containing protein n=1 Tax=Brachionus calyciflorus TaxID=104777 RepID=A0A813VK57_9BILA|nr:unnamed protein product [Brachionus calyciflorus]
MIICQIVLPIIIKYRLCSTCGSLNHQQKYCSKEQCCLKCAGYGHRIETCKSKYIQCLNCTDEQDIKQEQMAPSNKTESRLSDEIESVLSSKLNSNDSKTSSLEKILKSQSNAVRDINENLKILRSNIQEVESIYKTVEQINIRLCNFEEETKRKLFDVLRYFNPSQS